MMNNDNIISNNNISNDFFLGANSPDGFRSYFARSYDPSDGWRVWIIKGGPGTGKSTAMRNICLRARELGLYHERCFCSSDPDSLDAVIIPELKRAVYDGTAPHVMEPVCAGACENIVNFGEAWDSEILYSLRDEIADVSAQCSARHSTARLWLKAAAAFRENTYLAALDDIDRGKTERAARSLAGKLMMRNTLRGTPDEGVGKTEYRLFSAVTPKGVLMPGAKGFERLEYRTVIDDPTGAASSMLLDKLGEMLTAEGIDIIAGKCSQSGRTEHILVPTLSAIVSATVEMHPMSGNTRVIHGERFFGEGFYKAHKERIKLNKSGVKEMTDNAIREMAKAKAVHDRLEGLYAQAMDYDKTRQISEALTRAVMSDAKA